MSITQAKILSKRRGKKSRFVLAGGFGSVTSQEQALADAIAKSRKNNPFTIGAGKKFSPTQKEVATDGSTDTRKLTRRELNDIKRLDARNSGKRNKARAELILQAKRRAELRAIERLGNSNNSVKGKQGRGKLFGNF